MVRGGMSATSLGFPPFTRAVKALVIANVAVYLVVLLARLTVPEIARAILEYGCLTPVDLLGHWRVWQLVTYGFLHDPGGISHILFNMLGLWMFGSQFESDYGSRRFYEFYFWCLIGAGLVTVGVALAGLLAYHALPIGLFAVMGRIWGNATLGASGAVYGLLLAFGILHGNQQVYMFPLPIAIRARYFVMIWMLVSFVNAFGGSNGVAEFAHLGGALFGWLYIRFVPRYGLQAATSEGMFGLRNRYYRWKRRRAARKFEVYMRKNASADYFDENGNYRGPSTHGKDDDSGWVN